jgi:hypothetical protein
MIGMKDPAICDMDDKPRTVEPDKLGNVHLLSLGKSIGNDKGAKGWCDRGNYIVGEKGVYMDYSQMER